MHTSATSAVGRDTASLRWDRGAKRLLLGMTGLVLLLNVVGWGVLVLVVAPKN